MAEDEAQLGLRDRQKLRTRQRVRATALELFGQRGYDQVTVDDIAAACEISRATIFRYFPTKEDLVVGSDEAQFIELRETFLSRPTDEPVFDSLRQAVSMLSARFGGEAEHRQLLESSRLVHGHGALLARALELRAGWTATFAELIALRTTGEPRPGLREQVLAATVIAALQVATDEWISRGGRDDLPALLDQAMGLLADGFAAL